MKPHSISSDHASLTHESKRTFGAGEKLKLQARDAARNVGVVCNGNTCTTTRRSISRLWFSKENERRNWSYVAEDPIRTLMFLASWGHTWVFNLFKPSSSKFSGDNNNKLIYIVRKCKFNVIIFRKDDNYYLLLYNKKLKYLSILISISWCYLIYILTRV